MSNSAAELTKKDVAKEAARRYLADKAYLSVLGMLQPAKLRQIFKAVEVPEATPRLMRDVMAESDRFETVDRRWAASVRYSDPRRPLERLISEILQSAGMPLTVGVMAQELALVYNRAPEHYEEALPRFLTDPDRFFGTPDGRYGLASWLLFAASDDEADVVFENLLSEDQVAQFSEMCPKARWSVDSAADTAAAVVNDCKEPIPIKILALLAWRGLGEDFDPVDLYTGVLRDDRLMLLSDQKVYPAKAAKAFAKTLAKLAEELAALPMEPEEEEAEAPIEITESDKEGMVALVLQRGSVSAEELLDAVLEVGPEEPAYAGTLENLNQALAIDDRVMWLGGTRWSKIETFPDEVKVIPDSLVAPSIAPFETPEGDLYDQELEEDGFDGDLKAAIYDPLAEDVTDEDPARTMCQPNGDSQRCVLKYHHKMEGTFPLCQINPDFFGLEPEIIPIVLTDEGKRKNAYVNNSTRLIYGLKDFYKDITDVSGAVFYIEGTAKPGEYRFRYSAESDEQLGIDANRSLELLDLKARFESQEMPIFDVMSDILEHKPGMTFPQLVTEVNTVKRCSRLLVASIISSYHCFSTRGKSGRWQYDAKKRSQGFNKTKRKYIKK